MAKLPTSITFGDRANVTPEKLLELIERMYKDLAEAINNKPEIYQRTTDGQVDDTFLAQGSININTVTNKVEMLTAHLSPTAVTWKQLN